MVKILSGADSAKFDVKFYDLPKGVDIKTMAQLGCFVKNDEVVDYISTKVRKGEYPYATVGLPGTGLTHIWICGNEH